MRVWANTCLVTLGLLGFASSCGAIDAFPLSEVRPGLVGAGRTVFEGSRVESFEARVLGVLENVLGPRRSIILVRLSGGPLASTGVLQGMSGSPVYIDGRLLGAVAYSFAFSKEPIAGITPWEDMLEGAEPAGGMRRYLGGPRAPEAGFQPSLSRSRRASCARFWRPRRRSPSTPGPAKPPPLCRLLPLRSC